MASSWYLNGMVTQMNDMFKPGAKIKDTGKKFRTKHGSNGHGNAPGTKPYKFGTFAVDVADPAGKKPVPAGQEPKWLIDTGNRHFEPDAIRKIEDAVRDSLSRDGAELPIEFKMGAVLPAGSKAKADVVRTAAGYTVTIYCAP
jgi:hypothetical protein